MKKLLFTLFTVFFSLSFIQAAEKKLTASDAEAYDYFGYSVSISGDYAIVGAYGEDDGGNEAGAAYIYESVADLSLPVELTSFTAIAGDGQVTLKWTTASELNNDTFLLERSIDGDNFVLFAEIKGQGSTSQETNYIYTDESVYNGFTYYYRLADRDYSGVITYHKIINATPNSEGVNFEITGQVVKEYTLYQNYPNPFNPETTIRFAIPTTDSELKNIKLNIYNSLGQLVSTLFEGSISGGQYRMKWDGTNSEGLNQPSGTYFITFQSTQFIQIRKMILLR